jgi:hypothetical protein
MNTLSTTDISRPLPVPCMLRFESLFDQGGGLAFPCNRDGLVDLDTLSERARANYMFARMLIGREFHCPVVIGGAQSH